MRRQGRARKRVFWIKIGWLHLIAVIENACGRFCGVENVTCNTMIKEILYKAKHCWATLEEDCEAETKAKQNQT